MLNVCVLDSAMLGDNVDLSCFEKYGKLSVFDSTKSDKVLERIADADIVITSKVVLGDVLDEAKKLKLICITATGTNNVNLEIAKRNNIAVTNVSGYSTASVAQHTFALLLNVLEKVKYYDNYVKSGEYSKSNVPTHFGREFWELEGKTFGIIGLGAIGRSVAGIAKAFGCNVQYFSTSGKNNTDDYKRVSLEELLQSSDVVSIHAPLNENTQNLVNYEKIKMMKKSAILINVGRGGIVNEIDLKRALDEDLIWGAGLDVLKSEPIETNNSLLNIENNERLIITPHIGWTSIEARERLIQEVIKNIDAFLEGRARNRVC